MDDLKGMKMRMTGGAPTDMMKLLGGVPMLVGMTDVYLNLQKGVLDGAQSAYSAYTTWKLFEVAPYVCTAPTVCVTFMMAMNMDVWNGLPKDIQDAIMSVSGEKQAIRYGKELQDGGKVRQPDIVKAAGYKITYSDLTPEELAKWTEVGGKPAWASWVKKMEAKGVPGQKILDDVGVPNGPIWSLDQTLTSEQVYALEMVKEMDHPTCGKIKVTGVPVKLSLTPGAVELPPPTLGQHTEEVLTKVLGYSKTEVERLRREKVI